MLKACCRESTLSQLYAARLMNFCWMLLSYKEAALQSTSESSLARCIVTTESVSDIMQTKRPAARAR